MRTRDRYRLPFPAATCTALAAVAILMLALTPAARAVKVGDITRLDGERRNYLTGLGLVFGLRGTGDGGQYLPAMRPLVEMLKKLDNPVALPDLGNAVNVAIVMVMVELPPEGVRNGDQVDATVVSIGAASSLRGGHLFLAPLVGPRPDAGIFGLARGDIEEDGPIATRGIIRHGATIETDLPVQVIKDGYITLILDGNSAHRVTASTIAKIINDAEGNGEQLAIALDAKNVVIAIPQNERSRPTDFIGRIQQLPVRIMPTEARVVVNKKTGTIVITGDVEISPVVISHKGLTITTVTPTPLPSLRNPVITEKRALGLDTTRQGGAKLQELVEALDAIKVPSEDRISIIQSLYTSGYLHAKLIVE